MNEQVIDVPAQLSALVFGQTTVPRHACRDVSPGASDIDVTPWAETQIPERPDRYVNGGDDPQVKQVGAAVSHIHLPLQIPLFVDPD